MNVLECDIYRRFSEVHCKADILSYDMITFADIWNR